MSWSVSATGKASAVKAEIARQLGHIKCAEPEDTVKQLAAQLIEGALDAQAEGTVVSVLASGSQTSRKFEDGVWKDHTNQLRIEVQPLYGFVE